MWRREWCDLPHGAVEGSLEIDEGACDGVVVGSRREHRRPQDVLSQSRNFAESAALSGAGGGVAKVNDCLPEHALVGFAGDRLEHIGAAVVAGSRALSFRLWERTTKTALPSKDWHQDKEDLSMEWKRPENVLGAGLCGDALWRRLVGLARAWGAGMSEGDARKVAGGSRRRE